MSSTNFASLDSVGKLVWSRRTWAAARDQMLIKKITGSGENSPIQRITELTKTEKGDQCIYHLVADLVEDGGTGDDDREGNEEAMSSSSQTIIIDLLNHGVREKGKMSEQRTVLKTRELARDRLSYWLANRVDQMSILTLSGISYAYNTDGSLRPSKSKLKNLAFNASVTAPSTNRNLTFNGTTLLGPGDTGYGTANITTAYQPGYRMIAQASAYARTHRIKPLMSKGREYFIVLMHPIAYTGLKTDPTYQAALITAGQRGDDNPWFTGAEVTVDGMIVMQHPLVYNTLGAPNGSKWGASSLVNGSRTLILGAQALCMADLNVSDWVEKLFQYDSFWGINVDKMFGLQKPQFYSIYDKSVEDFGVLTVDHYLGFRTS